jgi:hypothetical protein
LAACAGTGLIAGMAERRPYKSDAAAQADHLAELLLQDRMDGLFNLTSIPLANAIAARDHARQLDALHGFLTEVAHQSAAEDSKLDTGGEWHQLPDGTPAWTIRALIDRSCDLDGMRLVRPGPEQNGSRFDDGPDSTRALRSGHVTQANADARLFELVLGIGDLLPTVKRAKPGPDDAAGLEDYRKVVNQELLVHNNTHGHVLGIWDPATMEAPEVKQRLLEWLPNLRLFACTPDLGQRPLLRVDQDSLEGWFVSSLRRIDQRRRALGGASPAKPSPTPTPTPTPKKESQPMPSPASQPINLINNGHIGSLSTGPHSPATQANDQAAVNQINATATNHELLQALEQLLAGTDARNAAHAPLRKATRELQSELEETGSISPPAVQRFERAKEGLSLTDQAISIAANVASLLAGAGFLS